MIIDETRTKKILNSATLEQQELITRSFELWEKTIALNGRPQHFDSFDTDRADILHQWYFLIEDISALDFDPDKGAANEASNSLKNEKTPGSTQTDHDTDQLSSKQRFEILKRDGFRCQLCGATAKHRARLEVDHKIPRSRGGSNDPSNLWTLCFNCNRGKRDSILKI